jgi:hypothetical protein
MGKRHRRSERALTSETVVVDLSSWLRRDTKLNVLGLRRNRETVIALSRTCSGQVRPETDSLQRAVR